MSREATCGVSACDGRCCAIFTYSSTPEELIERWRKWPDTSRQGRDDRYIADMLVPLSSEEVGERVERFDISVDFDLVKAAESGTKFYTCRHWDEDTRKCGAYEDRPKMCATYPYADKCAHCDCHAPAPVRVEYAGYRVRNYKPPYPLLEAGS